MAYIVMAYIVLASGMKMPAYRHVCVDACVDVCVDMCAGMRGDMGMDA